MAVRPSAPAANPTGALAGGDSPVLGCSASPNRIRIERIGCRQGMWAALGGADRPDHVCVASDQRTETVAVDHSIHPSIAFRSFPGQQRLSLANGRRSILAGTALHREDAFLLLGGAPPFLVGLSPSLA